MDFQVQRCTRRCATTGRSLQPGELFFSVLAVEGADVVRYDYSCDAWQGPPDAAIGWWKSQVPVSDSRRARWAPNDVMLDLFNSWLDEPDKEDFLYVLTLLLVRRRVMRLEEPQGPVPDPDTLVVYCPRRDETFSIACRPPSEARAGEIQEELGKLLLVGPER